MKSWLTVLQFSISAEGKINRMNRKDDSIAYHRIQFNGVKNMSISLDHIFEKNKTIKTAEIGILICIWCNREMLFPHYHSHISNIKLRQYTSSMQFCNSKMNERKKKKQIKAIGKRENLCPTLYL